MADKPTEEGRLVIQMTKALFKRDIDETFRIFGRFMDKHQLTVSEEVIDEFKVAKRIN